ncbi:helix-turn-helix transcriptional regulator [Goodfellowiella coeruleoviolacea]|uniref:Transcriptional regulator n=1 Tax=Goodfellowiella coeruleoviolacea TaxID=334858 RepID=A0AAE3KK62_9PSEU|nr:WYL domain-containing protein [Goodfellowiella coeruleoviolacea]MCP2169837.1 putative transcriptional regulator [Goodfellowiella coeruleoviolacea]
MRAERLVALLFTLQRKRSATVPELAAALGVSERTLHRDLAALREAGVPLWTEQGRHGGVRLVEGWRARLDGLTAREVVAIFALGVPEALAALGLGTAVSAAHAKVSAALPDQLRAQAEHVAGRFHLDARGWFRTPDEVGDVLAVLARAVWEQRRLAMRYQRRSTVVDRVVEPLGLVLKAGVWYLVARVPEPPRGSAGAASRELNQRGSGGAASRELDWHGSGGAASRELNQHGSGGEGSRELDWHGQVRTYRVARIAAADVLDARFDRPDGFDLAGWWRQSSAAFERVSFPLRARVRLSPLARRALPSVIGPEYLAEVLLSQGEPDADGWAEAELAVESHEIGLSQLIALGAGVEVLEPVSLRAALAEVGAAMAAHNAVRGPDQPADQR